MGRISGEPIPDTDHLVALSTRIPASIRKAVRIAALDNDMDVQDVVTEALRTWLATHQRRPMGS